MNDVEVSWKRWALLFFVWVATLALLLLSTCAGSPRSANSGGSASAAIYDACLSQCTIEAVKKPLSEPLDPFLIVTKAAVYCFCHTPDEGGR